MRGRRDDMGGAGGGSWPSGAARRRELQRSGSWARSMSASSDGPDCFALLHADTHEPSPGPFASSNAAPPSLSPTFQSEVNSQWLVPSKPHVNPPVAKPHANSWQPRVGHTVFVDRRIEAEGEEGHRNSGCHPCSGGDGRSSLATSVSISISLEGFIIHTSSF